MSHARRGRAATDPPLRLAEVLGARSPVAQQAVGRLLDALSGAGDPEASRRARAALGQWEALRGAPRAAPPGRRGARRLGAIVAAWAGRPADGIGDAEALFALHTYGAFVCTELARWLAGPDAEAGLDLWLSPFPFDWHRARRAAAPDAAHNAARNTALEAALEAALDRVQDLAPALAAHAAKGPVDLLKPLLQDLVPAEARRHLGEHYTPDWLAAHVLDALDFPRAETERILDPACGSGTFLVHALHRALRAPRGLGSVEPVPRSPEALAATLARVVGADRDPLAVLAARVNLLAAIRPHLPDEARLLALSALLPNGLPVYCADALAAAADQVPTRAPRDATAPARRIEGAGSRSTPEALARHAPFDVVAGNPPWVNWQTLPDAERARLAPLWAHYGLFPHAGFDALLGGANDDLAVLLSYAVTDRFLRPGGRLGFVLPQSLVKNAAAGKGFRRLRFGEATACAVRVDRVDDFGGLPVFGPGSVPCCVVLWTRGAATRFPVPYHLWRRAAGAPRGAPLTPARLPRAALGEVRAHTTRLACAAAPVDPSHPASPWLTAPPELLPALGRVLGPSPYRARVGVTTGGANAVYWVEVLEPVDARTVRVRNLVAGAKRKVPEVTAELEAERLYPLLRGRDVARFSATPSAHLVLPHSLEGDRTVLRAYDPAELRARWPRTHAYLQRFEPMLRGRALYRRFFTTRRKGQVIETGPYYALFDLGPYSATPYKAVWHRMRTPVGAALVGPQEGRPVLPQEVHTFVGCDREEEAAYLVGLLNASPFGVAALAYAQAGSKGFAAPHLLRHIYLPEFDPAERAHREVGRLARQAQSHWPDWSPRQRAALQERLDRAAAAVWGLSAEDLERFVRAAESLAPQ